MKYFSTFTGIGGLDMGLESIGAECVGFSEIKESSINIYKRHYPDHENYGDITKLDVDNLPDFDVLTGGFPCQSFSLAGARKGFEDRRGRMIFYLYDILMAKKPKYAVFENVKGIVQHDGGKTIENVFKLLMSAGYNVRVVLLNSLFYGSAQNRERVFFICRLGEDFEQKNPEVLDKSKRFRDIRSDYSEDDLISEKTEKRLKKKYPKGFHLIGGYDRVNTLTTGVSSSGRRMLITKGDNGDIRRLTCTEAERLQGFPDGWTDNEVLTNRWYALGNAVNVDVSKYLFEEYLKGLWW